jgi:hypothetical protein
MCIFPYKYLYVYLCNIVMYVIISVAYIIPRSNATIFFLCVLAWLLLPYPRSNAASVEVVFETSSVGRPLQYARVIENLSLGLL